MKFYEIFRFEITYQLRNAWTWLMVVVLIFLVFLFMRDGSLSEAMYTEFYINSPFMIAMATVFGSLLWLLTTGFIAGEAAARDLATGMHPLTYSLPITRGQYLGAKFLATFTLNAGVLATVQIAILIACYLPGVHPDSLGPLRPEAFVTAYVFIALPNTFAATTVQFAFSLRSGRPISAYLGSLLLFFIAFFLAALILFNQGIGTLLDPIGVRFVWDELSHLWTTYEKSWRLLELKGSLLQNRLVWIGTGVFAAALTYVRFQFVHRTVRTSWWRRAFSRHKPDSVLALSTKVSNPEHISVANATCVRSFDVAFHLRQMLTIAWASYRWVASSKAGLAMLIVIPLLAIPVIIDAMVALGTPLIPTTPMVIKELTGSLQSINRWMIIPGLIIYFSGELVWRERDNRLGDMTDTLPGSEWPRVLGKFLGIVLILITFTASLIIAGMLAQLIRGYTNFDAGLYAKVMFGLQLPEYILFAACMLMIHYVINKKYTAHFVAILVYAFIAAVAGMLGVEHHLLIYGSSPGWAYTEMRTFGPFLGPWIWFKFYWASWALLLLVFAVLMSVRGKDISINARLLALRQRMTYSLRWMVGISLALIITTGGYIFYNTNILNTWSNSLENGQWAAAYERLYGKYEDLPQPQIIKTKLHLEVYPEGRALQIRGTYELKNKTLITIDSLHISTPLGSAVMHSIGTNREATLVVDDVKQRYQIYKLSSPLKPGDTITINFEISVEPIGFGNGGLDPYLAETGSAFDNKLWFPAIGYQRMRGIVNPIQRRKYGLEPRELLSSLNEAHEGTALSFSSGIMFEAVIGTSRDQVAVAPGFLKRQWEEGERNYFEYASSAPIGSEWNFFSALYHAYEKKWVSSKVNHPPVVVRLYHYPKHTTHLETMMASAVASLEYFTEQFGPYPYSHLSIVEHPAAPGTGMHAEASMIYHGQGYPYLIAKDQQSFDLPYAVMGHEMGHQWSVPYAYVEGLPFMAEGIAWYYGIMLVHNTRGLAQTHQLMSFMRKPYPHAPIRRGEPLLRALDPYLAYKRGPLAMYALTQYAGINPVNQALRNLVTNGNSPDAIPLSTLDLYHQLSETLPDSTHNLLHDLFQVNTLWEFETNRVTAVNVGNDQWNVTLEVNAKKIVYDSEGVVTEKPMDEWIEIGVFAAGSRHNRLGKPLYLKSHRILSGNQTITMTVSGLPTLAGIDPHHILDWEEKEDDDNIKAVVINSAVKIK